MFKDFMKMLSFLSHENALWNILTKIIVYCKHLVTQPPSGDNDVEIKAFVSELVNDNEQTLFGLFVAANHLTMKGILSLAYDEVFRLFNITMKFSPEDEERMQSVNPWAFN
ncbi:hypothetical protein M9H77_36046 [Catharanthus roseus]|uniref:Uncharacterized protein n=1 Tax=Catharanthus roseus TaxID=4058 RepID=A0ACB9ZS04_CATRO|nr:hypothetical protein M9H77_36046 [Catharanthus roseus]